MERLTSQIGLYGTSSTPRNIDNYRSQYTNNLLSSSSSDDEEDYDEEDNDRSGTVVFIVDSIKN